MYLDELTTERIKASDEIMESVIRGLYRMELAKLAFINFTLSLSLSLCARTLNHVSKIAAMP